MLAMINLNGAVNFKTGLYIIKFPPPHGGRESKGLEMGKKIKGGKKEKTRPDTRQYSRRRLGRSSNAKTARNSKM